MKAMILAAGFGTRLRPFTNKRPKALVHYMGEPMIKRQIDRLKNAGVKEIVVNSHHFSKQIMDYFASNRFGVSGCVLREDEILGTGGGILNAREHFIDEDHFMVINVDVETDMDLERMIIHHESNMPLATIAVQRRPSGRYLEFTENMNLKGRQNDKSDEDLLYAFNGIHIISRSFFSLGFKEGFSDIISLYIEAISRDRNQIIGYDAGDSTFLDLGKVENLYYKDYS